MAALCMEDRTGRQATPISNSSAEKILTITPGIIGSPPGRACKRTGIEEKTRLVPTGLGAPMAGESGKKPSQLGGCERPPRPMTRRAARSVLAPCRTPGSHFRKKKYSWRSFGPSRSRSEASGVKPVSASSVVNSPVVKDVM